MKRPQYPWDSQFTPQKNTHFFILFEMSWPPKKLVRENSVELEWNGEIHKESFQSSVVSANLSNTNTTQNEYKKQTFDLPILDLPKILNRRSSFHCWLLRIRKYHSFPCTRSKHGKKKRKYRQDLSKPNYARMRSSVLERTLAPTWKYKNVLVVVVEKNTKSNRILNFDLWISHVKDGQQWSCSVSSGKKLPTATAYDQSYAVRTRHNNHHPGWMLVSEEFKNPCSEQLTWINSRVLGETDTLPVRERICKQRYSVS